MNSTVNRQIKFRAWNKNTRQMLDLQKITPLMTSNCVDEGLYIPKHPDLIIMQCTGVKDKMGNDIYEGDILLAPVGNRFVVEWEKEGRFLGFDKKRRIYYISKEPRVEIIGNIHENPELLEVK